MTIDKNTYSSPNYWTNWQLQHQFGVVRKPQFIVIHITEGVFPSDVKYLCADVPNPVSAHFYIRKDGIVYQLVDPVHSAWHCAVDESERVPRPDLLAVWGRGNNNFHSIGIECESPKGVPINTVQLGVLASLVKDLMRQYPDIKPDRLHIVGHYELKKTKTDPPNFDWSSFMMQVAPPTTPTLRLFPQTGLTIRGPFKEFYEMNGDLERFGFPLTGEEAEDNLIVQYFENVRLEWKANTPGYPRVGAVGRMYLKVIGRIK